MAKFWLTAALAVLAYSSTAVGQSWPSAAPPHHAATPYSAAPYHAPPISSRPYSPGPYSSGAYGAPPTTYAPTQNAMGPYASTYVASPRAWANNQVAPGPQTPTYSNNALPSASPAPQPRYRFARPSSDFRARFAPVRMQRLATPPAGPPPAVPPVAGPPVAAPPFVPSPTNPTPAITPPAITPPSTAAPQGHHHHPGAQGHSHPSESGRASSPRPEGSRLVQPQGEPPVKLQGPGLSAFAFETPSNPSYSFPGQSDVICDAADQEYLDAVSSARNGFFFQYDLLLWSITPPDTRVIGDPGSEGDFVVDGVTAHRVNSLDTGFIDYDTDSAHRFEFGHNEDETGWSMSILFGRNAQTHSANGVSFIPQDTSTLINERLLAGWADGNGDNIDDDLDGDNVHGNDGRDLGTPDGMGGFAAPFDGIPDQPAPQDNDDLVVYLPVFSTFTSRREVEMRGVEWMGAHRYGLNQSSHFELMAGMRFLEIDDSFGFSGSGGVLDTTSVSTSVRNQIFGPQIGMRWVGCCGPAWLSLEARLMAGLNYQRANQTGSIATNFVSGANLPAALTPFSFNSSRRNEEFAPIGEWRIESGYAINKYTRFKFGYTGMIIDGYSAALPKVQYSLPNFGMSAAGSRETVFITAMTLGIEINR